MSPVAYTDRNLASPPYLVLIVFPFLSITDTVSPYAIFCLLCHDSHRRSRSNIPGQVTTEGYPRPPGTALSLDFVKCLGTTEQGAEAGPQFVS